MVSFQTGAKKSTASLVKNVAPAPPVTASKAAKGSSNASPVVASAKKKKKKKGKVDLDGSKVEPSGADPADLENTIDDIFSSVATKKKDVSEKAEEEAVAKSVKPPTGPSDKPKDSNPPKPYQHGVIASTYGSIISPDPPLERIDKESGLKVYKTHLLRIGQGGNSPLCPFDCDCCF